MNPDTNCKEQHTNLVFKPQKLHQISVPSVHPHGLCSSFIQIMKNEVHNYIDSHVLSTSLTQSICGKHPCQHAHISLLAFLNASTVNDKIFHKIIFISNFALCFYNQLCLFLSLPPSLTSLHPFLPFFLPSLCCQKILTPSFTSFYTIFTILCPEPVSIEMTKARLTYQWFLPSPMMIHEEQTNGMRVRKIRRVKVGWEGKEGKCYLHTVTEHSGFMPWVSQ
jgi:hypothetical protein